MLVIAIWGCYNMCRKKEVQQGKGADTMNATVEVKRPCSVSESIKQSCMEVKMMREGKAPKNSLDELFANIAEWGKEGRD